MSAHTWTPLWSMIVDSSLWQEEDDGTCKVFITMMALKDADHVVRLSAYKIGKRCNKTELQILAAIKVLSEPDTKRIEEQEFEGRRVQKVDGGWLMLNGQKYQELMQEMVRNRQQAQWAREERMIQRAVRTGEGIHPVQLTAALRDRYRNALKKAVKEQGIEAGARDIEDWINKGKIPPRRKAPVEGLGFSRETVTAAAAAMAEGLMSDPGQVGTVEGPGGEEEGPVQEAVGDNVEKRRRDEREARELRERLAVGLGRPEPAVDENRVAIAPRGARAVGQLMKVGEQSTEAPVEEGPVDGPQCRVGSDGECHWEGCPLLPLVENGCEQLPRCPYAEQEEGEL